MKKRIVIAASVAALALVATTVLVAAGSSDRQSTTQVTSVETHYSDARVVQFTADAIIEPIKAKQEVVMRVVDTIIFTSKEIDALGNKLENIYARAAYMVISGHNGDALVAPVYDFHTHPTMPNLYVVEVRGYLSRFIEWNGEKKDIPSNSDSHIKIHADFSNRK